MKNNRSYQKNQNIADTKAENQIDYLQDTLINLEPDEPQKKEPVHPDIENDPTRIEPGINDPVKNDPTRVDDLPPVFSENYL
jgi:hypothetical protein